MKQIQSVMIILIILFLVTCRNKRESDKREKLDSTIYKKDMVIKKEEIVDSSQAVPESIIPDDLLKGDYYYTDSGYVNFFYGLKILTRNDSLKAIFYGPSPQEEHGMFYFISPVSDMIFKDSINFLIETYKGDLYKDSITSINVLELMQSKTSGFENIGIHLKGTVKSSDTLLIKCETGYIYDCYLEEGIFVRVK